jgi:hypothetical protein
MTDVALTLLSYLLKGVIFLLVFSLFVAVSSFLIDRFRFRRLVQARAGLSICQFARSFDYRHVDTRIIRAVYEGFQREALPGVKDFPVKASDDIAKVYGMVGEDLEEFAEELAGELGRRWGGFEENPLYGQVTLVGDLVLFLNRQPEVGA